MPTFQVRAGVQVEAEKWKPHGCREVVKTNDPIPSHHPLQKGAVRPYGTYQGDRAMQLVLNGDYLVSVDGRSIPVPRELFEAVFREKPEFAVISDSEGNPWGDKVVSRTSIGFSFMDRIRILFRGEMEVTHFVHTEHEVGRARTEADISVSPVWRVRRRFAADGLGCQAGVIGVSVWQREDVECGI